MTDTLFADAEDPALIPAEFTLAALYSGDCDHPAPLELARQRWPGDRARWITFGGARRCSIADFEPGTEVYHDRPRLYTWAHVRQISKLGPSIIYSSLGNVAAAQLAVRGAAHLWWLATEGTGPLTAAQLSDMLAKMYGVTVHPAQIWAQQEIDPALPYDKSRLFGAWR